MYLRYTIKKRITAYISISYVFARILGVQNSETDFVKTVELNYKLWLVFAWKMVILIKKTYY